MLINTMKTRDANWNNKEWVSKKVVDDLTASQGYKKERMELWRSLDKLYRSRHLYYYRNRSNLFVPVIFWNIENIVPRWAGVEQRIIYLPQNNAQFVPQGPVMTRFWDYQWRRMKGQLLLIEMLKTALKYGLVIYKPYWFRDVQPTYRWRRDFPGMPPIPGLRFPEPTTMTMHDGPMGEVIMPWMSYWSPDATDIQSSTYFAYLKSNYLGALREDERLKLEDFKSYGHDTSLHVIEYWRDDRKIQLASIKEIDKSGWGSNPDTGEQDIDAGENHGGENFKVIENRPNPLWYPKKPFLRVVDYPIEKKFFGLSTAEVIESLQVEVNTFRNLRMDHSQLALQPVTLVGKRARLKEFKRYPGAVLHVLDKNEIEELKTGDFRNAGAMEMADLHRDIQRTVGTNEAVEGGAVQPSRTPVGTLQMVDQLGSVRIAFKSQILAHSFFADLSTWHRHLNRQFLPDEQAFGVGGPMAREYLRVPPEIWEQEWDAYPVIVGADSNSPQAKTAEILGFVNSISPIIEKAEMLRQQGVEPRKIIEQILFQYQGIFDNPQEIMIPLEQIMAQQQAGGGAPMLPPGQGQAPEARFPAMPAGVF